MGQYLQFRHWLTRSSGPEKALAGTAFGVVVALTGLALVPTGQDGAGTTEVALGQESSGLGTGGVDLGAPLGSADPAAGLPGGTTATGPLAGTGTGTSGQPAPGVGTGALGSGGVSGGGVSGGGAAGGSSGSAGGATAGPGTAGAGSGSRGTTTAPGGNAVGGRSASCAPGAREVGVTDTTITVASVLLDLGGAIGNGAVGIASADQQKQMSEAVVKEVNATGGAACRKLVVKYFTANPLDASSARQACLQIVEAKVYAVVDGSGFAYPAGAADCVAQNKIPIVSAPGPVPSEYKKLFPYYMSVLSYDPTQSYRNMVIGMQRRGFFDPAKGFKKLGLFMDECSPEINDSLLKDLARIGISRKSISIYTFSCPSGGFASPSEASAGVVRHRQDGVTHVIPVTGGGSFKSYSAFAQQQGYKPVYTNGDYNGFPITTTGGTGPDRDNYDGTVAVTSLKIGMESSGFTDAPTEACKALLKRRGINPAWVTNGYQGGSYCDMYRLFAAAATKAPRLTRVDLHLGVGALGKVDLAYINGNAVYSNTDLIGGDDYWVIQYGKGCNCWKVIDRTRRPSER